MIRKLLFLGSLLAGLWLISCKSAVNKRFLLSEDITFEAATEKPSGSRNLNKKAGHRDPLSYVPDTNHLAQFPIRKIRVNFHFLNVLDRKKIFHAK